jgi:carboxypeptidase Q
MRRLPFPARLTLIAFCLLALGAGARAESLAERYREAAARLTGEAMLSDDAYDNLGLLCDGIGHRLSGSPQLEEAIVWAQAIMQAEGLRNVHAEPVLVPGWVRGDERAWLSSPTRHSLSMLGLGMSIGTPPEGLSGEVVVVGSFDELDALPADEVAGKFVLYDVPYEGYGQTVKYRWRGASEAARRGAVAALVRSIGPVGHDTPHTGSMGYQDSVPRIPAAAVSAENAAMMHRMQERGDRIVCHLEMGARLLPDQPSANVVGEIVGSECPDEFVLLGGHLDSWDVGQGAQDDGAGCIIAMEAAHLIHRLGLSPRRSIRVVLFTNEENGSRGGKGYRDAHADELDSYVAAIESDSGNGLATGFSLSIKALRGVPDEGETTPEPALVEARRRALAILTEIAPLLSGLGADQMRLGGSGADIGPIVELGVPGLGMRHDASKYFEIHPTRADTFDRIVKADLDRNVAILAILAYVLADMPGRL